MLRVLVTCLVLIPVLRVLASKVAPEFLDGAPGDASSSIFLQLDLKVQGSAEGSQLLAHDHQEVTLLKLQWFEQLKATESRSPSSPSSTALQWSVIRRFPPVVDYQLDAQCSNIGQRFPILVSRNQSILDAYRNYACKTAPDYFITDPRLTLTAEHAALENGCINLHRFPKVLLATNGTHRYNAYRRCSGSCQDDERRPLSVQMVNENLLVLPTLRTPVGMAYQHALTDLLPSAFTMLEHLRKSNMKLVVHTQIHSKMLQSLGIPLDQLLEIPFQSLEEVTEKLLCVSPGHTLTLWRTGKDGGGELPTFDYADHRRYGDFWWRLPGYRVVPELSDAIAKRAGWAKEARQQTVVFVQRCNERRALANEQAALAAVSSLLVASQQDYQLSSFCPGREDFLEQVKKLRQARLIIGEHGGALANMLLSRHGTGVIELVGSREAQVGLEGEFPPYKSMWYGGAGAAFPFYRVVLYEPGERGNTVRLEDLQDAVQQWLEK